MRNQSKIREAVLLKRPVLKRILEEHGSKTLYEYAESFLHSSQKNNANPVASARKQEFLSVFEEECARLLGRETARFAAKDLADNYFVSTADHHGPICHPFFLNGNLLLAAALSERGAKSVVILPCANISLNNSSFPRGLFYHSKGEEVRIPFFPSKMGEHSVLNQQPYKKDFVAKKIPKSVRDIYLHPGVLALNDYADQVTKTNFEIFKMVAPMNLVYIPQENLARSLLLKHLDKPESIIHKILFDPKTQQLVKKHFDRIQGAFDLQAKHGTFLFWRLPLGQKQPGEKKHEINKRIQMWDIDRQQLRAGLEQGFLVPSMLLSFVILSFYYGLTCFGGFSQIDYLGEMKNAYLKLLEELGGESESSAWQADKSIAAEVATDRFCGEFVFNYAGKDPATILDLIRQGGIKNWPKTLKRIKLKSLNEAVAPMFPEFYKIIYGGRDFNHTKCLYCGANPVPHYLEWYHQTLDVLLAPLRKKILYSSPGIILQKIAAKFIYGLVFILSKIGLVRRNNDGQKIKIPRAKVLWDEAVAQGIPITELRFLDYPIDLYEVKINREKLIFSGLPRPKKYYNQALDWLDDKYFLKKALAAKNLPVAKGSSTATLSGALDIFKSLQKPVIVKPRLGSRGRHTTTNIYTEEQFRQAYKIAKQLCAWVIVEEHLKGPVWRGTVVGGFCVGVLGGNPPMVTGDGQSTIERLIVLANAARLARVEEIVVDEKMKDFLNRNSLDLQTILPGGLQIYLSEKIGIAYGGSSYEVFDQAHPDNIKMFEEAAAAVGDPILGFDFICEDIGKSWQGQRCGIIECNGLPFINLHHDPLHGAPRNIAKYLWEYIKQAS